MAVCRQAKPRAAHIGANRVFRIACTIVSFHCTTTVSSAAAIRGRPIQTVSRTAAVATLVNDFIVCESPAHRPPRHRFLRVPLALPGVPSGCVSERSHDTGRDGRNQPRLLFFLSEGFGGERGESRGNVSEDLAEHRFLR